MFIYNYVEMARVTGVPLSFLLSRGQSIKVSENGMSRFSIYIWTTGWIFMILLFSGAFSAFEKS